MLGVDYLRITGAAHGPGALVVRQDEDNIGGVDSPLSLQSQPGKLLWRAVIVFHQPHQVSDHPLFNRRILDRVVLLRDQSPDRTGTCRTRPG